LEYSLGYIVKTTLKYVFVLNSEWINDMMHFMLARFKEGCRRLIAPGIRMLRLLRASLTCSDTCTDQVCTPLVTNCQLVLSTHSSSPLNYRKSFPSYLQEGMLEAISIQALAQVV
jgi:hypothetical protein